MTRLILIGAAVIAALAALIFALPAPERASERAGASSLAITNVTVFDGARFIEDQTILIEDGHVAALGVDLAVPEGVRVIDGAGRTALPGLIDAHTHTWGSGLDATLAFGVTTHLDMFSSPLELPGAIAAREDLSVLNRADLFSAGMLATAEGGHGTQFGVPVETLARPDEAQAWVAARIEEGSDYIKLAYIPGAAGLPSLDLATATAVIEAGHDQGLMVVAHIATRDAAREMIDAGIDGLVHIFADAPVDADFLAAAREADIFVIPTLTIIASAAGTGAGAELAADPRVAGALSPGALRTLQGGFGMPPSALFQYPLAEANVRALHEAGIPILAGSDAPNPGTAYGASLHQEIALLAEAGLSVEDALSAATQGAADMFALEGRGRIAPGARADLVLMEGDPREDLTATLSIAAVIRNGAVLDDPAQSGTRPAGRPPQTADIAVFEAETNGFAWTVTTDAMAGGDSQARSSHEDGVLRTEITIQRGFAFPWAGPAYLPAGADSPALDLSAYQAVSFRVRAARGSYRVMTFEPELVGIPPTITVELDESWRTVRLPLDDFAGFDRSSFAGLALVGGPAPGETWIELTDIRFEMAP